MSKHVPAETGFLCDKAAFLGDAIKGARASSLISFHFASIACAGICGRSDAT